MVRGGYGVQGIGVLKPSALGIREFRSLDLGVWVWGRANRG